MIVCFCVVLIGGPKQKSWSMTEKKNQKSVKPTCSSGDYFALWSRTPLILGDPGAVSRVGRKGRTKVFKYGRKSPWVPTFTKLFSKIQANAGRDWAQKMLFIIVPNSFSWVLFGSSYTTTIISITACLDHAPKEMHVVRKLSVWYKIPIWFQNTVCAPARKLKALFQKYKLELTTGIHACIGHVLRNY